MLASPLASPASWRLIAALGVLALAACSGSNGSLPAMAGAVDAHAPDAAGDGAVTLTDAGVPADAGKPAFDDASGLVDSAQVDLGVLLDAGRVADAAPVSDAAQDSGLRDAGADSGAGPD